MGSYISPRGSPTPSSVSSTSMPPPNQASMPPPNQAGDNGSGDPASMVTYSDGGTTYFYSSDDVVSLKTVKTVKSVKSTKVASLAEW